jgi:hypothetical protein
MNRRLALLTVTALSCGGPSPSGSGSVTGADAFTVKSALSNVGTTDGGLGILVVFLSDLDTNCADVGKRGQLPFEKSALLSNVVSNGPPAAVVAQVDGGVGVAGAVAVQHLGSEDLASAGSIDISALDSTHALGTISVTISPNAGAPAPMTATFDAPICGSVPVGP